MNDDYRCPKCGDEQLTPGDDGLYCEGCGFYIMAFDRTIRETGLVEWMCPHGVGHPDERSAAYIASVMEEKYKNGQHTTEIWLVHGCDGCCGRDDFPGRAPHEEACPVKPVGPDKLRDLR
jgi:DNA-directed RNA polymerase subunit RPC12/RpoP